MARMARALGYAAARSSAMAAQAYGVARACWLFDAGVRHEACASAMSTALVKASERDLCGKCGARLLCGFCSVGDVVQDARLALSEVVKGMGGRNAIARVAAAKIILAKDFLAYLSDEDLLAEVKRRTGK